MHSLLKILLAAFIAVSLVPASGVQAKGKISVSKEDVGLSRESIQPAANRNAESPGKNSAGEIVTRLPNGLLVYILRDTRFPLVCTRLYVRTGSANEAPDQAGISHVLEHMVFKGTSHRPKGQIARDVEANGGYLNAATSFDKTWYLTDMPASQWRMGMDVVRDMAFQATLDADELQAEKDVVVSELQRGEDSPMRKLFENLQTATLKNTPYGRPIIGFENTIRALTVDDLRTYIARWYQPQNMMLLVVGDIVPGEVLDYAQNLFGNLANTTDLAVPEPLDLADAAKGSQQVETSRGPWNKVYIGIAMPAPGFKDLRSNELDVLCYLLGGDGTSDFYKKYKYDLQLVDNIDVSNMSLARGGMMSVTAQLDADKVEEFWNLVTRDMASLAAKSFAEEAIARAKFNLEDSIDRAGETLNGLAALKGTIQFDLGGQQGEDNIRFTQRNIDREQLQNAIDKWVDSRQARVRVLAPQDAKLPDFAAIMQDNWPQITQSAATHTGDNERSAPEYINLENNCVLVLLPDASAPYVAFDMLMPGGNAMLSENQQGLAGLVARLLTDGSGDLNRDAMERWLAERAASVSCRAGLQTFGISLTGPARFNKDYFSVFRDIVRKPRFDPQELKREVENMKSAIRQRNDRPLSYMFAKLAPFIFPGNQSYGYDNLGTDSSLDTFNVVNVRDFWTIQSAQPWVLAIAGQFDREAVLEFVKGLPIPRSAKFETKAPVWGDKRALDLKLPGRNQAHLLQIFRTIPPTDEDEPALMLLQSILSGQSGLLFTQLRDQQGLGYTVTAYNRSMPQTGYMAFYIGTTPDKVEQAKKGFAEIINRLKTENLPQADLDAGANRLLGDHVRGLQSLSSRAGEAATDQVLGWPRDFQKKLIDRAAKLTPDDLRRVAQKYLDNPYEIVLLP